MSEVATYRHAIEDVVGLLKSRWVPAVLVALAGGPLRYGDLLAEIHDKQVRSGRADQKPLTEKMLTTTLRSLEQAQLVANHRQTDTFAGGSWYDLTTDGKTLLVALRPVIAWAADYRQKMGDDQPGTNTAE